MWEVQLHPEALSTQARHNVQNDPTLLSAKLNSLLHTLQKDKPQNNELNPYFASSGCRCISEPCERLYVQLLFAFCSRSRWGYETIASFKIPAVFKLLKRRVSFRCAWKSILRHVLCCTTWRDCRSWPWEVFAKLGALGLQTFQSLSEES